MLTFQCAACGQELRVKEELAGKKGKCPRCAQPLRVPSALLRAAEGVKGGPRTGPSPVDSGSAVGDSRPCPAVEMSVIPGDTRDGMDSQPGEEDTPAGPESYDFLAPPQGPGELGRLGPYRVLKVLGSGGMGIVFEAEDPQLKRAVALKVMHPDKSGKAHNRQRFLREAQATAAIEHDHIVTIYQVGEDRNIPFLAMQLLQGEPLDERLQREGALPITEGLRIGREAAEGLAAAHARGLIHRDIKPANIWLEGGRGRVKILDFGLARAASDNAQLTKIGSLIGTPAYMAPEQAGGGRVDARSDLYSLGCVLYAMCTGEPPFKGKNTLSILSALALDTPPRADAVNLNVPAALADLIEKLLAKEPEDRPASAQAVVEAIETVGRKPTPASTRITTSPRALKPAAEKEETCAGRGAKTRETRRGDRDREAGARRERASSPRNRPLAKDSTALVWMAAGGAAALALLAVPLFVFVVRPLMVREPAAAVVQNNAPPSGLPILPQPVVAPVPPDPEPRPQPVPPVEQPRPADPKPPDPKPNPAPVPQPDPPPPDPKPNPDPVPPPAPNRPAAAVDVDLLARFPERYQGQRIRVHVIMAAGVVGRGDKYELQIANLNGAKPAVHFAITRDISLQITALGMKLHEVRPPVRLTGTVNGNEPNGKRPQLTVDTVEFLDNQGKTTRTIVDETNAPPAAAVPPVPGGLVDVSLLARFPERYRGQRVSVEGVMSGGPVTRGDKHDLQMEAGVGVLFAISRDICLQVGALGALHEKRPRVRLVGVVGAEPIGKRTQLTVDKIEFLDNQGKTTRTIVDQTGLQ